MAAQVCRAPIQANHFYRVGFEMGLRAVAVLWTWTRKDEGEMERKE